MSDSSAPRWTGLWIALLAAAVAAPSVRAEAPADPPLVAAAAATAKAAPAVTAARIVGDDKRTRFVADLSGPIAVGVFTLADPYRVIVDLPEVGFAVPDGTGQEGRGLFSAFRYGQITKGKSRIVLDATGPVRVDKSFVLRPVKDQPARLVIDVVPTTRQAFLKLSNAYRESQNLAASAERARTLVAPQPKAANGRPIIVVDPGHGGIDLGTHGKEGVDEKVITLAFAKALGERLEASGLYKVFYTRTDDSFVALGDRVAFARAHHADLFVSIHANSFPGGSIRGATIYTVSEEASDQMAGDEAARENQSDVLAGLDIGEDNSDEVMDILFDLTRRETRNFGVVFARTLIKEMRGSNRMFKVPHQTARFKVLEAPDIPSAMIELGFITNKDDEKLLLSEEWRAKTANSVVQGIAGYFRTRVAEKAEQ